VFVLVKKSNESAKIVKCEYLEKATSQMCVPATADYTFHTIKPAFLLHCKVSATYENGIQVSFLGGINGNIFADHLDRDGVSKYKVGEKLVARIIAVDPLTKYISLSLLPHLVQMASTRDSLVLNNLTVGRVIENAKVLKAVYGSSY
jgi:ribosomal protein S1